MKLIMIFSVLSLFSLSPAGVQEYEKKNFIALSLGAPALYSGISYERVVFEKDYFKLLPRIGAGFNIFEPSLGHEYNFHTSLTGLFGNNYHSFESGAGVIHYFLQQKGFSEKTFYSYKPILFCLTGYRYSFAKIPLFLKIALAPILVLNKDKNIFFPFAEIAAGISF